MSAPRLAVSRRAALASGGALVLSFSLLPSGLLAQGAAPSLPGDLKKAPLLDSWISIGVDGQVTIFTGKAELGQGIRTALIQIAAEELSLPVERITLVTADTARTPDEEFTSGSQSMSDSGTAIQHACAQVREIMIGIAAGRLNMPAESLKVAGGFVRADDGRSVGYSELVSAGLLHVSAAPQSKRKDPKTYSIVGTPMARVDIPPKVTGGVAYVHDLRLPNMVHARLIAPPSYGATLQGFDAATFDNLPGLLKIHRDGNYLAVIAEHEYQSVLAMNAVAAGVTWDERHPLPDPAAIHDYLKSLPAQDYVILDRGAVGAAQGTRVEASFTRPYQMHGSIGPSCAVGLFKDGTLTVWAHSQGMFPLRKSLAELVRLPEDRIRCIHLEGSGCYGHNGADDAGADAALLAMAMPDRPVRVQWMRDQEHGWEPYGAAMQSKVSATLDSSGRIADWSYDVWSNPHSTRPGGAGNLMAGWLIASPFAQPAPRPIPQPAGGGDRNAIPLYAIPNAKVVHHFIPEMPLRVSALRALGAYMNVFSIESVMDDLARAAGADPVKFRLDHLTDSRAKDVIELAASRFGWTTWNKRGQRHGRGFAFARYKNFAAYCALAVELEVERDTGRVRLMRAVAAVDSGQAVNPDGIRNQIEGAIVQAASWTLHERVVFDQSGILSRDWGSYPIMRFPDLFESVEVHVIDRPGQPFLGTGEAGQGPSAAAIANAIADASGARIRDLPLDRDRVAAAVSL